MDRDETRGQETAQVYATGHATACSRRRRGADQSNVGTSDGINHAGLDQGPGVGTGDSSELAEGPVVGTGDGSGSDEVPADYTGLHDKPSDGIFA